MKIFDLHTDLLTEVSARKHYKISKNSIAQGLSGSCYAVFTTGLSPAQVFEHSNNFCALKNKFEAEGSAFDLKLSYEDLDFVNETNIHSLLLTNPVMCGLTWNFDNKMAGGALGQNGLSAVGAKIVSILEEFKVFVDCAHLNEKSFMDVAKQAKRPIVCSHTCFAELCNNPRNVHDYQIRIIKESGGIVGLSVVGQFLSPTKRATVDDFIAHILHYVNTFGTTDGLAIGTDFFGTKNLPKNFRNYGAFAYVEKTLIDLGFLEEEIENIFFNNAAALLNQPH